MSEYAVFGNPVGHSRSPQIHRAFAAQRQQPISYERLEAPLDSFVTHVRHFFADEGKGANVTVPFKEDAFRLCQTHTERAKRAGAVNTLMLKGGHLHGDNTDGAGLVRDLRENLGWQLSGRRILILGAGGAVRGVLAPLLETAPAEITIANRTESKAEELAEQFQDMGIPVYGTGLAQPGHQYDVIINAISAGLHGDMPALPDDLLAERGVCYDMVYGDEPTPFLRWAETRGAAASADGLGMLVEQAAESFYGWHNWRPKTAPVIEALRRGELD